MRKIGILTLNGYFNYGNRLQNYALQETLRSMGFEVETVINEDLFNRSRKVTFYERMSNLMKKSPVDIYTRFRDKIWTSKNKEEIIKSEEIRTNIFRKFTLNYIKETDFTISDDMILDEIMDIYDYFVTGSDQVWNPSYNYGSSIFFLNFAPKHKRIAYAPSFGVSEIEEEYKENYKEWISGMQRLSVREDAGAKIIKDLTRRDAPVLVDPTLLLTKEKWLSISKQASNKPKGKYLLTYFLGGVPDAHKKQIKNIANNNELEIINLGDIKERESYRTGPSEFLDYINSCSIFCTDSFHGAVFSILFEKPFIVYERMGTHLSMFSRINTLLDKFELQSRKYENIRTNKEIFNIDFSNVPFILGNERDKAANYLKEALNVEEEFSMGE